MLYFILILYIFTGLSTATDSKDISPVNNAGRINRATQEVFSFQSSLSNSPTPSNAIFFRKDENQVRIPTKIYEEYKKKKMIKKSPKRTIQKIIKKGKNRSRKIYVNPITRLPTAPSQKVEMVDNGSNQNDDVTTGNPRRRLRKHSKVARYPMPFHKLQPRKDLVRHRNRRDAGQDELYILKDLDEMEFLDKSDKDYSIVNTHVKKYW